MKNKTWLILPLLLVSFACLPEKQIGSAEEFDRHLNAGLSFMQQKNYLMAKQEFNQALSINPRSARVNNLLGLVYFREQDYDYAEMYFQKAIKLDPSFATGYLNMGAVYAIRELYPKAREYYEKALSISPQMISAYYSLGAICFEMGEREKGLDYLTKGLELDPDYLEKHPDSLTGLSMKGSALPELYFSFAKLYARMDDVERTVGYLKKARLHGFKDWDRIEKEPEFNKVKDHPLIREFLK